MTLLSSLTFLSGFCFIYYGINCIISKQMKSEFKRFGIPQFRVLTGILQLIGGTGLIVGFFFSPIIAYLAALGLAVLMFMGFITRLKIKDGMLASTPALFFALLNTYLTFLYA